MSKKQELTPEQIEKLQEAQAKKEARELRDSNIKTYKSLVDSQLEIIFPHIEMMSQQMSSLKKNIFTSFNSAIALKKDLYGERVDQNYSHMFTNSKSNLRITIGSNYKDDWDDTVTSGIDLAKQRVESLAIDDNSRALVRVILQLLSKNSKGELKASKVLQLRKIASELHDDLLLEAVEIIESAHRPTVTATYIIAEKKDPSGRWIKIPLSATEV